MVDVARTALFLAFPGLAGPAAASEASSPDIASGKPDEAKFIISGFGCTGQNLSPAVSWRNPPAVRVS